MNPISTKLTRRQFNQTLGIGTFAFVVGCERKQMTPAQAVRHGTRLEVLTVAEAQCFGALAEVLLPGAQQAGVVPFVDHQLAADDHEVLLMIRYFSIPKPFRDFYRGGLAQLEVASNRQFAAGFRSLPIHQQQELVTAMSRDKISDWQGPPQSFFYLLARNDAVDVVYGTVAGFESLGIPYMPHIPPSALT